MLDLHEEILKTLRATPAVLQAVTARVDSVLARHRPAPGQWAVVEVVGHMADTDERAHARLDRMITETDPYLPASTRMPSWNRLATSGVTCPSLSPATQTRARRT